jgi:hypothetical protein
MSWGIRGSKTETLHETQVAFSPDWTPQHKGLQLVCCIVTTYGNVHMYGWGASIREAIDKFSNFMHLKQLEDLVQIFSCFKRHFSWY